MEEIKLYTLILNILKQTQNTSFNYIRENGNSRLSSIHIRGERADLTIWLYNFCCPLKERVAIQFFNEAEICTFSWGLEAINEVYKAIENSELYWLTEGIDE